MTSPTSQQWRNTVGGLFAGAGFCSRFLFYRDKKDTTDKIRFMLYYAETYKRYVYFQKNILYNNLA